jgi:hypothetical protein
LKIFDIRADFGFSKNGAWILERKNPYLVSNAHVDIDAANRGLAIACSLFGLVIKQRNLEMEMYYEDSAVDKIQNYDNDLTQLFKELSKAYPIGSPTTSEINKKIQILQKHFEFLLNNKKPKEGL